MWNFKTINKQQRYKFSEFSTQNQQKEKKKKNENHISYIRNNQLN